MAAIVAASRRAQTGTEEARAPMLGVMGAFVFAAQMINFPVGPGTTGHLLGAALLAITLGPAAAMVVLTAVLAVQALVFQDGGLLALGANVFNMAVAGVAAAWLPYRLLGSGRLRPVGIVLAGFCSVAASALLALGELRLSGVPIPRSLALASLGLFAVNGILEGLITLAVIRALGRMNAAWAPVPQRLSPKAALALGGAAVALVTGGLLAASPAPDGLESLAGKLGIEGRAYVLWVAPLAEYRTALVGHTWFSAAVAGLIGAGLSFAVVYVAGRTRAKRRGV